MIGLGSYQIYDLKRQPLQQPTVDKTCKVEVLYDYVNWTLSFTMSPYKWTQNKLSSPVSLSVVLEDKSLDSGKVKASALIDTVSFSALIIQLDTFKEASCFKWRNLKLSENVLTEI